MRQIGDPSGGGEGELLIWLIVLSGWPPNEVLESLQFNDICGYSEYPQRVFKIKIELVVQQIPTE